MRPLGAVGAQALRSLTGVCLPWQPQTVALGHSESLVLAGQHLGVLSATFWLPRAAAEQSIQAEKPEEDAAKGSLEITWTSLPLRPGRWPEPNTFSEGYFFFLVRTALEEQ